MNAVLDHSHADQVALPLKLFAFWKVDVLVLETLKVVALREAG